MNKSSYFEPIDFLRVLATIMIFCLHTSIFSGQIGFQFSTTTWFLQTPAWAGVWIFFILSGFLIGKGFINGRYNYTPKGIIIFYMSRIFKIAIPTWFFILLCLVLVQPQFAISYPEIIWQNLLFIYDSTPGFDGPSATWYISTLIQLYLVAPFIYKMIDYAIVKFNKKNKSLQGAIFILILIVILGFSVRLIAYKLKLDWSSRVYVPSYMNLDLFASGVIFNYISRNIKITINNKIFGWMYYIVLGVVIINAYIYFKQYYFMYQYVFPSMYILVIGTFLVLASKRINIKYMRPYSPLKLITRFSSITFGFYLFHSLILSKIYIFFSESYPVFSHIYLLVVGFVITLPFAYFFNSVVKSSTNIYKNFLKRIEKND